VRVHGDEAINVNGLKTGRDARIISVVKVRGVRGTKPPAPI